MIEVYAGKQYLTNVCIVVVCTQTNKQREIMHNISTGSQRPSGCCGEIATDTPPSTQTPAETSNPTSTLHATSPLPPAMTYLAWAMSIIQTTRSRSHAVGLALEVLRTLDQVRNEGWSLSWVSMPTQNRLRDVTQELNLVLGWEFKTKVERAVVVLGLIIFGLNQGFELRLENTVLGIWIDFPFSPLVMGERRPPILQ
jgi:hypothetical protein